MKQKKHSTEEIIRILRQADGDGAIESICREHNISKATIHRWRRKYGDMDLADAKRLKELERENGELKKMLAESMLKNRVLEEVNAKNGKPGAEEASRRLCGRPAAVLRASGVSVFGSISIDLSLSGQVATPSTGSIASAHRVVILAVSALRLSTHPCCIGAGRLVGQPQAGPAYPSERGLEGPSQASAHIPAGCFNRPADPGDPS